MKTFTIPPNSCHAERDAIIRRATTHMMRALRKIERMKQEQESDGRVAPDNARKAS